MQDKIDTTKKDDKGTMNDESGKLGGDKSHESGKYDQGKGKDESKVGQPKP